MAAGASGSYTCCSCRFFPSARHGCSERMVDKHELFASVAGHLNHLVVSWDHTLQTGPRRFLEDGKIIGQIASDQDSSRSEGIGPMMVETT